MSLAIYALIAIIFFITILFAVFLIARNRQVISKIGITIFVFSVGCGFLLYFCNYLLSGSEFFVAFFRGIISATRMFLIEPDIFSENFFDNILVNIFFCLVHVFALISIQIALLSLFGRKFIDNIRLMFGLYDELYIIKGCDKNAILLGENIVTHDAKQEYPDNRRAIVFLIEEDDDENEIYDKVSHFDGIVKVRDNNSNGFQICLKKIVVKKRKKYNIILTPEDTLASDSAFYVAKYANEKNIPQENLEIFVIVSSKWDKEKIRKLAAKDSFGKYTTHIINEVDLLTRKMIESHLPIDALNIDTDFSNGEMIRKDGFTVMLIGFSDVGQSAFLRLIMNGQFVGSRMRAIIMDKNVDDLLGCFYRSCPELQLCCDVIPQKSELPCVNLFNQLDKFDNIDYFVVALNNDEINKRTALDIQEYYERKDKLPVIAVYEEKGGLSELNDNEKVFTFGCREEMYKESIIIRADIDCMAKAINHVYDANSNWHEIGWDKQESSRASADFVPAMLKLANVDKEKVMKENILTRDTELIETLSKQEHLRWNAFHVAMGYKRISIEEMKRRFEKYGGNKDSLEPARRDSKSRLQVCLVSWDELDELTEEYVKLAHKAGNIKEQKRDFKSNDRDIVESIPKFLAEANKTKS